MKTLYYDCFSDISGDMNLGAMVNLGVNEVFLQDELTKLPIRGEFWLEIYEDSRCGIAGIKVDVIPTGPVNASHGRHLCEIEDIIYSSILDDPVKQTAWAIFLKLARAEAAVHETTVAKVHFHEVGAVDAIVDIVGAAICFHYLKIDKVIASPVELGDGFTDCAHGRIPVPAPATAELLKSVPVISGAVPFETTTPTGAAILVSLADEFTTIVPFKGLICGHGIGTRDNRLPNVLRACLG